METVTPIRTGDGRLPSNAHQLIHSAAARVALPVSFLLFLSLFCSLPARAQESSFQDKLDNFFKEAPVLYKNPDNRWIQQLRFQGRYHYQVAYLTGEDANQNSFNYNTDEIRRFFAGFKMDFLEYFHFSGQANIFRDREPVGGKRGFKFAHLWDSYIKTDIRKLGGIESLDSLALGYGRAEVNVAEEWNISSRRIKTIERTALANRVWPSDMEFSNPTGAWLEGSKNPIYAKLGVFSTTTADDFLAPWSDGELYYGKLTYDMSDRTTMDKTEWLLNGFYQDIDSTDSRLAGGVESALSLGLRLADDVWGLSLNGVTGNNGEQSSPTREGNFYGFVVTPTLWLVQEKLELAFQYQYQASDEPQGIRINSRYARRAESAGNANLAGGRGDKHHSFYSGVNYYISGHNAKFMAGVSYDDIDSQGAQVFDGWTFLAAFRIYF